MGLWFAVNHGVVTTPLAVATATLGNELGTVGNGTLYAATLLSSLFLGAPLVSSLGSKGGLLLGMLFYCIYVGCFAAAVASSPGAWLQWALFLVGSGCGGLAAGVLWTAQGGYFASTADGLAAATGQERQQATAGLAGSFAFVYLALEVASKVGFSVLQKVQLDLGLIALVYLVVGVASLAMMAGIIDFRTETKEEVNPLSKLLSATSLWSDPVIWLLAPTNLAFGFSAAYMNGYINGTFATQELGKESVAFLGAVTALTAAVLARAYGSLSEKFGKAPVIAIGSACFLAIPLSQSLLGCCGGWGWLILGLYLLQGSGRAVYESTNRALFSDFFPGSKSEGAFANCMLQSSLAFAVCFFLQSSIAPKDLGSIVLGLSALIVPGYLVAKQVRSGPVIEAE